MVPGTRQPRPPHGLRRLAAAVAAALPLLGAAAPRPALDVGPAGAFDTGRVTGPVVRREADGSWRLWYTGSDASDTTADGRTGRIGLARSADGLAWVRVPGEGTGGAILEPTVDPDRFDTGHIAVSDVAADGDRLVLWYAGVRTDAARVSTGQQRRGGPLAAVRAVSTDGVRFQRDTGPSAGALLAPGDAALGNPASIGGPQVVATGPRRFLLYYHAPGADGRSTVFVGTSRDGRSFAGAGPALGPGSPGDFDADGVGARHVLPDGDGFLMVYEGLSRGLPTGIGLARSGDGRRFTRVRGPLPGGAILRPDRDRRAWDGGRVGQPWLVPLPDGRFRLYYSGAPRARGWSRAAPAWRIGVAESGPTLMDFRRPGG